MQGGFEAAVHLLSLPQKPTAVVCWNDLVAIGMMNGIARAGLVPGGDMSVTGYDDLEEASIATPALTTVWNGQSEVGRIAARALLDKLTGSHEPDGIHLIKPEMRIRQSTGPYRAPVALNRIFKRKIMSDNRIPVLVPGKIHPRVLETLCRSASNRLRSTAATNPSVDAEMAAQCARHRGRRRLQCRLHRCLPQSRRSSPISASAMTASMPGMPPRRASWSPIRPMC